MGFGGRFLSRWSEHGMGYHIAIADAAVASQAASVAPLAASIISPFLGNFCMCREDALLSFSFAFAAYLGVLFFLCLFLLLRDAASKDPARVRSPHSHPDSPTEAPHLRH